jgi:hypothetical protein
MLGCCARRRKAGKERERDEGFPLMKPLYIWRIRIQMKEKIIALFTVFH